MNTITPQLIERLKNCEPETFEKIDVMSYHDTCGSVEYDFGDGWSHRCNPTWNWERVKYRPFEQKPPQPRYRPWEGPHEVRVGILFREKSNPGVELAPLERRAGKIYLGGSFHLTFQELFNNYQCSYDGQNWTVCGVECK